MPVDWSKYPDDWHDTANRIKADAGWKCQICGKQCRRPKEPFDTHKRTLTVAHINHVEHDCRDENLVAACPACHLAYDGERKKLQRLALKRMHSAERMELFDDENVDAPNPFVEIMEAIERSAFDLSPCRGCGLPVVCIPDGLPFCELCESDDDDHPDGCNCHGCGECAVCKSVARETAAARARAMGERKRREHFARLMGGDDMLHTEVAEHG